MTNTILVDMLVKGGMTVNEAVEALADYTEADYIAEKEQEAREEAEWEAWVALIREEMDWCLCRQEGLS